MAEEESCDALDPIVGVVYFKKKRLKKTANGPAGSYYNGRVEKGVKCSNLAIVVRLIDGKRVKRCARHLNLA